MNINRICGSNEFFWARFKDGRLRLCFTDLVITSRNLAPEVAVFTNSESVSQDIFSQDARQVIDARDIVKRIPRDCVCGIGGGMDGLQTTVRIPESELEFRRMSEASVGYLNNSRETVTSSPCREDVSKSDEFTPQKAQECFSDASNRDDNLVYSMCQEILIHTLTFPDLNHNSKGSIVHPNFKKPSSVSSNLRLQNPKGKVKQNPSKKKSTLICRKLVEDLVKTLTTSRRQEGKKIKYNSQGSIINIWTRRDIYPYEAQDDCVNVDGLEFRSFLSTEHLESFLSQHQATCHSVTIFESVKDTPATPRTRGNPATQAISPKNRGCRKDQSKLTDQTLEVKETPPTPPELGSSGDGAPTSQTHEKVEIHDSGPTASASESEAKFTTPTAVSEAPDTSPGEHKTMVLVPTFTFLAEAAAVPAVATVLVPGCVSARVTKDSASALDNSASDVRIPKKRGRPLGLEEKQEREDGSIC